MAQCRECLAFLALAAVGCGSSAVAPESRDPPDRQPDLPPRIEIVAPDSVYVGFRFRVDLLVEADMGLGLDALDFEWGDGEREWPISNPVNPQNVSKVHSYSTAGYFTIAVTATDGAQQTTVSTHSIAVTHPPPLPPEPPAHVQVGSSGGFLWISWQPGILATAHRVEIIDRETMAAVYVEEMLYPPIGDESMRTSLIPAGVRMIPGHEYTVLVFGINQYGETASEPLLFRL